jgi:hypothetical protein
MSQFISCDWGTSSLRLRLVEVEYETQNVFVPAGKLSLPQWNAYWH